MKRRSFVWPGLPIALLAALVISDSVVVAIACRAPKLVTDMPVIHAPDAASHTGGAPSTAEVPPLVHTNIVDEDKSRLVQDR